MGKLCVRPNGRKQFIVESVPDVTENWDRDYVSFSGFFGPHSPHLFAAAPELLEALKELIEACDDEALDDADDDRHASALDRQTAAMRAAQAAITKAEGR